MSDLNHEIMPPYLPDLIGDDAVAEAVLSYGGRTVVVRYHPAILMRVERAPLVADEAQWEWIRAMLVEVIDGEVRYGGEDGVPALTDPLKLLVRDIFDDLGEHVAQWGVAWIEAHQEEVGRLQLRYRRQRGLE